MRSVGNDAVFIASHSVRIMIGLLEENNFDTSAILESLGLSKTKVEDPDCVVTIRQELSLQRRFAELTGDLPGLWYQTGLRYGVLTYGSLGLASLCADTVGEALAMFVHSFQDLNYSLLHYQLETARGRTIAIETSDEDVVEDLWAFSQERSLGSVIRLMRDFAPDVQSIVSIESALPERPAWLTTPTLDGIPVSFGHARSRWLLAAGVGEKRLPLANHMLKATYRRLCEKLIERMSAQTGLVSRVYMLLLHGGIEMFSMNRAAAELCIHERTLQRKLADSGLTFSDLVAQVREQKAKALLRASDKTVGQIAEELGFIETASFSHAFKRWTGEAPLEFRKLYRG